MARTKLLLLGVLTLGAAVLFKRDKVMALLPSRSGETPSYTPPAPGPSNYDAPGPVANTATPVPAPEPSQPPAVDEAAEEAAAAAEAANIGGAVSDYAGPADLPATEAERPLAESGEGEAEGREQLSEQPTEPADWTPPSADPPAASDEPAPEGEPDPEPAPAAEEEKKDEPVDWRTWSGRSIDP